MKITVNEAMRLKGEISKAINSLQMQSVSYGTIVEDGTNMADNANIPFQEWLEKLKALFVMSEEINSVLAKFNVDNFVSDSVRHKANIDVLIQYCQSAMAQSTPKTMARYEIVGANRVKIEQQFVPTCSKQALKDQLKQLKESKRKLLEVIDKANASTIELKFSMEEFEALAE